MGVHHSLIYSVPVTSCKTPNETEVYRHYKSPESLISSPKEGDIETLQDILLFTQSYHGKKPCLGKRNKDGVFEFEDYNTCMEKATWVASGIINLNLAPNVKEFQDFDLKLYGIFSKNCVEFLLLDMGAALFGLTSVPIYDTLGTQAVTYILEQTNLFTIFVSKANIEVLLKFNSLKNLRNVVSFDGFTEEQRKKLAEIGIKIWDFMEVMESGKEKTLEYPEVKSGDIYTFSYTSGTTGILFYCVFLII